jgi:hypothetical protein
LGFELPEDEMSRLQPVIRDFEVHMYQLAINFIVIGRIISRSEYVRTSLSIDMEDVLTVAQWDQLLSFVLCVLSHVVDISIQHMRELHEPLKRKFRRTGDRRSFPAYLFDAAVLQYDTCWPLQGYTSPHGTSHVSDSVSGGVIFRMHFTRDELDLPVKCVVDRFKGASGKMDTEGLERALTALDAAREIETKGAIMTVDGDMKSDLIFKKFIKWLKKRCATHMAKNLGKFVRESLPKIKCAMKNCVSIRGHRFTGDMLARIQAAFWNMLKEAQGLYVPRIPMAAGDGGVDEDEEVDFAALHNEFYAMREKRAGAIKAFITQVHHMPKHYQNQHIITRQVDTLTDRWGGTWSDMPREPRKSGQEWWGACTEEAEWVWFEIEVACLVCAKTCITVTEAPGRHFCSECFAENPREIEDAKQLLSSRFKGPSRGGGRAVGRGGRGGARGGRGAVSGASP